MKQLYILTTTLLMLCFSNTALAQTTEVVSQLAYTYGILFDGDELYISNPKIGGLANSRLYKTNITEQPTTLTDVVATENLNTPYGLALNGTDLYTTKITCVICDNSDNINYISKIDLTTPLPATVTNIELPGVIEAFDLVLNGTDLYISDYEGSKIFKIDISLENPTPELVATGIVYPIGMAISGSDLYVIGLNKILKIDLTATLPTTATEFVTGLGYAYDILINGTDLYFSDLFFSKIYKIDLTADTPIATSILGVTFPTSLALKDGYLYIATNPNLNARSVHDDNAIVTFELHPLSVVAGGDQTYCPETQQNIVTPLFNITDPDDTTLEVFNIQITSGYVNGEDQLTLTGTHPNIEATWIASQAKLTLTGPGGGDANIIDVIAAVKAVVFESSNLNPIAKTFSLTAGSASFLPSNNHYYDFVPSELITWTDAKAAAESMSYNGIQGYLATLTAADEIQLAGELSPGTGWIGANSVENEGVWNWVTGPEAGTTFWNGDDTGAAAPGMLSNWNDLEPNNLSIEQYVHITEPGFGIPGSWNNLPNDTATQVDSYQATGFVVEYGGMPGDPVLSISASTTLTPVLVSPSNFDPINAICEGDILDPLPTTSNEGFTGTWTPVLDNTTTTLYTFTPDGGQCANLANLTITVVQKTDPTFTAVADICNGDILVPLATTSNNGITGSWNPALDNTLTTTYTFTPSPTECANPTTLTIVVNQKVNPLFTPVDDICNGDVLASLPTTSNDGIIGTWTPVLDNTTTTLYTFTPDAGLCANAATLVILVNQKTDPTFAAINDICNGDALDPLPTTSNNGVNGTWTPVLDTTLTTLYTFTPDTGECANPATLTITVIQKVDSIFNPIGAICSGGPLVPHPTTSNNGITGTWSPALDNTITTLYTFTPDAGECANPTTLTMLVNQRVDPTFMAVGGICDGAVLAPLPTTSNEGINGTWSPALNNTITTLYTFTPDAGECANPTTLTITVDDPVDPVFTPINDICNGEALAPLPPTSNNGITGTWSQAPSNTATAVYIFTPNAWECANPTTLSITVNQKVDPDFTAVGDICNGDVLAPLPTTSNDGIIGTWSPALDNTLTTRYTFTPDPDECANPTILTIVVNQKINPDFTPVDDTCTGTVLFPLPTTSNNGVTGTWSPALDNTTTTLYTFTPDAGLCANPATLTILVIQKLDPIFDPINLICEGDLLAPLPTNSNQGIAGTWSPALDNTVTTVYTFTPNADECANPTNLTVTVIPNSISTFTQIDSICAGETITLLTQSNQGFNGSWSPAVDNTTTTTYTFTADPGECADPTTMTVVVIPVNVLTISAINLSEEFDANQVISVTASGGSGTYEYQLDGGDWQFSSIFEYVIGCDEHTAAVRDVIDTCNTQAETTVAIIEFPKFFTPNGDGYNDTWNINCFLDDPSAIVRLSDRYGKLLYEFKPNQDTWDGSFNGMILPSTDYWFVVNYINSNGVETIYRSHFSLRR